MASKVPLAEVASAEEIRAAVGSTAKAGFYKAIGSGSPYGKARETALTQVCGAATREVSKAGRETLLKQVKADPWATGWIRVSDGRPCPFCAMLLSRGPVYKSEATAEFHAHDHCGCMAEPFHAGSEWPEQNREMQRIWQEKVAGKKEPLKAFRQELEGRAPKVGEAVKPEEWELWRPTPERVQEVTRYHDEEIERWFDADPEVADEWDRLERLHDKGIDTVSEFKRRAEAGMRELTDHPLTVRRGKQGSLGIIKDGRFKTQFETGSSKGYLNPPARAGAEEIGLGCPMTLEDAMRPVYGYFDTGAFEAGHYGEVKWILSDSVKARTTMTVGDSLDAFMQGDAVGTSALSPGIEGFSDTNSMLDLVLQQGWGQWNYLQNVARMNNYVEAQIQGGVTLDDVVEVVIETSPMRAGLFDEVVERLHKLGIPVRMESA